MIFRLFFEFFKVGLFAVGGGLAALPFLSDLSEKTAWFSVEELANYVAVAESTPGPIGINVATYVGYRVLGVWGALIASFGLVLPSFIVITIVYFILDKFKNNKYVMGTFNGIRPASNGLIFSALFSLCSISFFNAGIVNIKACLLATLVFILSNFVPKIKKMHPIVFILLGAVIGIILKL